MPKRSYTLLAISTPLIVSSGPIPINARSGGNLHCRVNGLRVAWNGRADVISQTRKPFRNIVGYIGIVLYNQNFSSFRQSSLSLFVGRFGRLVINPRLPQSEHPMHVKPGRRDLLILTKKPSFEEKTRFCTTVEIGRFLLRLQTYEFTAATA